MSVTERKMPVPATAAATPEWLATLLVPVLVGLGCLGLLILLAGTRSAGAGQAPIAAFMLLLAAGCVWAIWRFRLGWKQRRELLANDPGKLAIGAIARAWLPAIGVQQLAFNLVVLAITVLAVAVAALLGEFAGQLTGLLLSAPLFLLLPMLLWRLAARQPAVLPVKTEGSAAGTGYAVLLGFAAMVLGIVGSWHAIHGWTLQRAEVVETSRLSDLSVHRGRNLLLGVRNVIPARDLTVRSYGWLERRTGPNRETASRYYRVYVTPLIDRRTMSAPGADVLDRACVWLGARHKDSSAGPASAVRGLVDRMRADRARELLATETRWLREVIWTDVAAGDDSKRYRHAIGGLDDAERGCSPLVLRAVASPETLRADAWGRLLWYFGVVNALPLLLLLGYGIWRLDRVGADELLVTTRSSQDKRREPDPLQRAFRVSDADGEHFRAGRLSQRQQQRLRRGLWLAAGGGLAVMLFIAMAAILAILLAGHVWLGAGSGWLAKAASAAAVLLSLVFLVGWPIEQWRKYALVREDLRVGRVERLAGRLHRHMIRRHKAASAYWVILDGERFDVTDSIHAALKNDATYALYHLPRSRRLLAILPEVLPDVAAGQVPQRQAAESPDAAALAQALDFSAEELAVNQTGRIAERQRSRLRRGQFSWLLDPGWYVAIAFFGAGGVVVPWLVRTQGLASLAEAIFFGSISVLLAVWMLLMGWRKEALPRRRDLREGRVEQLGGICRYEGNGQDSDSGHMFDEIHLDDQRMLVTRATRLALVHGRAYRFYVAAHSRQILSAEAVDQPSTA